MLETSSRCSFRNQCRNCSPTRSFSSRASSTRPAICCVTVFSCASASSTGSAAFLNEVFGSATPDEHHRVVSLLDRLAVEVRCELRQRLGVVVDRDRDVLLRRGELVADLLVHD